MSNLFSIMSLEETQKAIDLSGPTPVVVAQSSESLLTVLYTPRDSDLQEPHEQDEIYVVAAGSALLEVGGNRTPIAQGDAAFVAAKAQHRFIEISDDFAVWAVFPGSA